MVFKKNAPFINCVSKINGVQIDNAEDLDVVIPMYNLLEYIKNYRETTGSFWNYYKDKPNSGINGGINYLIMGSKSFDYKANFIEGGVTQNILAKNDVKIVVPLKYLSNFWRTLNTPLINCEVELILTWFKNCVLISKVTRDTNYAANPVVHKIDNPENATKSRYKIICSSCYFIKIKWYKTFRTAKIRIFKNYKMEKIQITNECSK